jgi:hypothetical protein
VLLDEGSVYPETGCDFLSDFVRPLSSFTTGARRTSDGFTYWRLPTVAVSPGWHAYTPTLFFENSSWRKRGWTAKRFWN